ncbi:MAG: YihA family ribosome biogenesis GTP-binding protein [Alphaproteobacteria bacterium]|nr:YihA family ribosome biogenesis GTP-binding protein [Alphaproteobacteria bacterium]
MTPEQLPPTEEGLPEVAFWGRSNVGKSSLLNALVGQKSLARTSNTPGRTQQIIFFNLGERLLLVDLPGYGHAKAPKSDIARWSGLIRRYLRTRATLRCVCLLIDSRHGASALDHEMMAMLDQNAVNYQIVLTKEDYLSAQERGERLEETKALAKQHPAARPEIILTSAQKKTGLDLLRTDLATLAQEP